DTSLRQGCLESCLPKSLPGKNKNSQSTGRFRVVVPEAPVFSVSGSDVVLSCSVREEFSLNIISAVDLNVTWSRSDLRDSLVHLYGNHKDLNTGQNPSYRGRTAVFKEQLKNGDASLKLSNIRICDEAEYTCRVESKSWLRDKTIKLSVEGKHFIFLFIASVTSLHRSLVFVQAVAWLYRFVVFSSDVRNTSVQILQNTNVCRDATFQKLK
uniref:Ig-like domain-containing protein n=1 Tax=Astyanax mexicanus TaxID=7994 RepID=A0A3B1IYE4_ASTMX